MEVYRELGSITIKYSIFSLSFFFLFFFFFLPFQFSPISPFSLLIILLHPKMDLADAVGFVRPWKTSILSHGFNPRQFEYHPRDDRLLVFGTMEGEVVVMNHLSNQILCGDLNHRYFFREKWRSKPLSLLFFWFLLISFFLKGLTFVFDFK